MSIMVALYLYLMKNIVLFLLLVLSLHVIGGNSDKEKSGKRTLSGKVAGQYGESLAGSRIEILETGETVYTDFDGNFQLSCKTDAVYTLNISTLGYLPKTLKSNELSMFQEISLDVLKP
jgi:hypothetical protein